MGLHNDNLRAHTSMTPVSGATRDEVGEARARLIRVMAGIAWSDRTLFQKVAWVFLSAFCWLCGVGGVGFFSGVVLLIFSALAGVPPEGNYDGAHGTCPMCEFVIHGAFSIGVIASTALLTWTMANRERTIRRLRALSNGQFLREYDAWRDLQRRLATQEQRRRDLDYQAERIGFWTDHYSRRGEPRW